MYLTFRLRDEAGIARDALADTMRILGLNPHPESPGEYLTHRGVIYPQPLSGDAPVRELVMRLSWASTHLEITDALDLAERLNAEVLLEDVELPKNVSAVDWLKQEAFRFTEKMNLVGVTAAFPILEAGEARTFIKVIEATSHTDLCDQLMELAVAYAHHRASWQMASLEGRQGIEPVRTAAHNAFIDACNILARAMGRSGEDSSWRVALGDDRKRIGDFACAIHHELALRAR